MSRSDSDRSVRMLISGRVQGVSFRYFTRRAAQQLGLVGWVRNLPGGEVEVRVTGRPESLEELRRRLRQGPHGARVDSLDESELESPEDWRDFRIVF